MTDKNPKPNTHYPTEQRNSVLPTNSLPMEMPVVQPPKVPTPAPSQNTTKK